MVIQRMLHSSTHTRAALWLLAAFLLVSLAACTARRDTSRPLPTVLLPAPQTAHRLVVVLPGRADDLDALKASGVARAIQDVWADADVQLVEVTLGDYREGKAIPRLHDEIIVPAQARGYRQIWLGGASMGGMGTLLYDSQYPGQMSGLLLLAPYLGENPIHEEIVAAGGLAKWKAGPSEPLGDDTWQRVLWRHIQSFANEPGANRRVWLAYGDKDSLGAAIALMTPALLTDHVLVRPGGHRWSVWTPAMRELLQRASSESSAPR